MGPAVRRLERGLKRKDQQTTRSLLVEGLRYLAKVHKGDEETVERCALTERLVSKVEVVDEKGHKAQGELFE